MKCLEVIESKRWQHKITGRRVSIYGAVPWNSNTERLDWELVSIGWTWRMSDGTVGMCKPPAKRKEDALKVMERFNRGAK